MVSSPQPDERGVDGNKWVKGIVLHELCCLLGLLLAVLVTAANVRDTAAAGPQLDRAAGNGWAPERVKVDVIYVVPRMAAAAERHDIDVQFSSKEAGVKGIKLLPLCSRIEATFGTQTNRYRRLTRNLEQSPKAAEDAREIANFHRVLRAYSRDETANSSSNRLQQRH